MPMTSEPESIVLKRQEGAVDMFTRLVNMYRFLCEDGHEEIKATFLQGCNVGVPEDSRITLDNVKELLPELIAHFRGITEGTVTTGAQELQTRLRMLQRGAKLVCAQHANDADNVPFQHMKDALLWSIQLGFSTPGQSLGSEGPVLKDMREREAARRERTPVGFESSRQQ